MMTPEQYARFEKRFGPEPVRFQTGTQKFALKFHKWAKQRQGYSAACQDEADAVTGLVNALEQCLTAMQTSAARGIPFDLNAFAIRIAADALKAYKGDAK